MISVVSFSGMVTQVLKNRPKNVLLLLLISVQSLQGKNIQVISKVGGGFFSDFFSVLHHLTWCDKHNLQPYVYWGNRSLYYEKDLGENAWENYFEQLSNFHYSSTSTNVDIRNTFHSVDGFAIHYARGYDKIIQVPFRQYLYGIIKKYIKVKQHITTIVDDYYKTYFAGKITIGIHIRGTDKSREVNPVSIERLCAQANECAQGLSNIQFFVATDEERLLKKATQLLSGPVLAYTSYRSTNGRPIHRNRLHHKYLLGEDVLVETLLLSKCNIFVHTRSNVSTAALFFNPELKNFLLM